MTTPYFLFELAQHLIAVEATCVEEVFALPELTLIPDAPAGIIGVIDLRGDIVPVMDFQLPAEGQATAYQLTDHLVMLRQGAIRVGLRVDGVQGLREMILEATVLSGVEAPATFHPNLTTLISNCQVEDETLWLLQAPQTWGNAAEIQQFASVASFLAHEIHQGSLPNRFHEAVTLEAELVFRHRAENLSQSVGNSQSPEASQPVVVVELQEHLLGLEAQAVREFIPLEQATPIPCCPRHIVGSLNLRGEIVTIIDIAEVLGLAARTLPRNLKVVILETQALTVGIVVDEIRDAMFSVSQEALSAPAAAAAIRSTFSGGETLYQHQPLQVLDLQALLSSDALVVNEMV